MRRCPKHPICTLGCDTCFAVGRQLLFAPSANYRAKGGYRLATRQEWDRFLREVHAPKVECACHGGTCACKLTTGGKRKATPKPTAPKPSPLPAAAARVTAIATATAVALLVHDQQQKAREARFDPMSLVRHSERFFG